MKWFAYGTRRYFNNSIRRLDLVLTAINVVTSIMYSAQHHVASQLWFRFSTASRALRLIKLVRCHSVLLACLTVLIR